MSDASDHSAQSRRRILKKLGTVTTSTLFTTQIGTASGEGARSRSNTPVDAPDELEGATRLIPAQPGAGFNYPYFLYTPPLINDGARPILVEPNNTGTTSDDFSLHRREARDLIENGFPRLISTELRVPALVPVFHRPTSDPVHWRHVIHSLDRDTIQIDSGPLERVDKQLIKMIEHAQSLLKNRGYPLVEKVLLNGFSSSGEFVNRFTALHPELVKSVTAGGINGMVILPRDSAKGETLNYHLGIADLKELTGSTFDRDAFVEVPQLIYMGAASEHDTLPNEDTWDQPLKQKAYTVYGEDMQDDRFPYCESVYQEAGSDAEFRLYDGVGHRISDKMQRDVVEFHRKQLDGDYSDISLPAVIDHVTGVDWAGEAVSAAAVGSLAAGGIGYYLKDRWQE